MLSGHDDYPIHQSSLPVSETSTSDINFYDRYFFNGYDHDGSGYFALAMGLYPNRHVADAAFSLVRHGQQISVFASQRAPADRRDATKVGPITINVVEPMQALHISVDAPGQGIRAELTFAARSSAVEEPHYWWRVGVRTIFDYTRFTQFGDWSGWIEVDGDRRELSPGDAWGSRDRSWGVRPTGESAPTGAPVSAPQFFWLWAPVNFPSLSTHFDSNEYGDGRRWHEVGAIVRPGGAAPESMRAVDYRVEWRPGTRWAQAFEYDLVDWNDRIHTVKLVPLYEFQMSGLGYGHPEFGHGMWRGESIVAAERIALPVPTPCTRQHLHVQAVCDARYLSPDGATEHGMGILEQLVIGEHSTGLTGVFDAYQPTGGPPAGPSQR
ncbi:MAG TPA: hypothetical protein VHN36_12875 [Ilumatobacteraceae bacterium]|nr:hypothetical protein [Ilumatobacteraceae bacterium]